MICCNVSVEVSEHGLPHGAAVSLVVETKAELDIRT
jgi:hypothetical protein